MSGAARGGRVAGEVRQSSKHVERPGAAVPNDVLVPLRARTGRALMLGHVHPDADVLGTLLGIGLALEARGWSVVYGGPHPAPGVLRFLPGVERYRKIEGVPGSFDVAILTDCPNPDRTEGLLEATRSAARTIVNIDHHPDNRRYGDVNWVDPSAAATGELAYALLVALGDPISPAIATNLFTAIHTDTGSFRYSNVTPTTFQIAAALAEAGADPAFVASSLYERREPDALRWLGEALGRVRLSEDGAVSWLALPADLVPESFVESEDLVNYPRSVGSVRVACLFRERGGRVKVSLRGKGDVDVNRIAAAFGGGGHPNAAGCSVAGSLEGVTDAVLAAVREALDRGVPR